MARNPFWDIAMNRNKFSACLTTQTLENQSSLNQNFVKSCWMSAEGYWFFFFNRSLSEKSRKLSNLIKVKEVFLNHCFFFNFCESTSKTCWSNVQSCHDFQIESQSFLLSNAETKRDKKQGLMKTPRFVLFIRLICIL